MCDRLVDAMSDRANTFEIIPQQTVWKCLVNVFDLLGDAHCIKGSYASVTSAMSDAGWLLTNLELLLLQTQLLSAFSTSRALSLVLLGRCHGRCHEI